MLFCTSCGKELRDGAKFCDICGTAVQDQTITKRENNSRRIVYEGEIHKCPNCGETLESFTNKCPSCGLEIRGVNSSNALQEFESRLSNTSNKQEKIAFIRNFPIPNTKEDVLEFLILATSNVTHNMDRDLSSAWKSKTEQAYQKARLIFQDDLEFNLVQVEYNKFCEIVNQDRKIEKANKRGNVISDLMPVLPQFVIVFGWLLSIYVLMALCKDYSVAPILLIIDFIVGAKFIPHALKSKSVLPELVVALGLVLSIILNVIISRKYGMGIFLLVDIICSASIFKKMFQSNNMSDESKHDFNIVSFYISIVSVGIMFVAYVLTGIFAPHIVKKIKKENKAPTVTVDQETDDDAGIYVYEIKDYTGRNLASMGRFYGSDYVDEYGNDYLRLVFVTYDGMLINPNDEENLKNYIVIEQNIKPGTKLTQVHERDDKGHPYRNLVDFQSYDEIVLYVDKIGEEAHDYAYKEISPVLDKHCYYIRDYVGRNAASFGTEFGKSRMDEYGNARVKLVFTEENGEYIDSMDVNELKKYIITSQNIKVNTELKVVYSKDSEGQEYSNLVDSQSYDEINFTVKKLDEKIIQHLPEIETE